MRDHYQILGVPRTASQESIRVAFKKLALKYHPDRNPNNRVAEEKFKEISHAYDTLSNPEKRARYDLILSYSDATAYYTKKSDAGYENVYKYKKRKPATRPYKYEFGWTYIKHQMMAFGFVFIVAILVLTFQAIYNYQVEKEKARQEAIRTSRLEAAVLNFRTGNYKASFDSIQHLIKVYPGEFDIRDSKRKLLKEIKAIAENNFNKGAYKEAASNYKVATQYEEPYLVHQRLYFKLAICYEKLEEYQKAADILNRILIQDHENIKLNVELGKIYGTMLNNYTKAMEYYDRARRRVRYTLRSAYGNAYEIVINPEKLPDIYYEVYHGRSYVNQKLGNYEEAIKDSNWAIFFRRNSKDDYLIRGNLYHDLGENRNACEDWVTARNLGSEEAEKALKAFCL